eukprot:2243-Chlamydomonas_euryale.AAC.3
MRGSVSPSELLRFWRTGASPCSGSGARVPAQAGTLNADRALALGWRHVAAIRCPDVCAGPAYGDVCAALNNARSMCSLKSNYQELHKLWAGSKGDTIPAPQRPVEDARVASDALPSHTHFWMSHKCTGTLRTGDCLRAVAILEIRLA